MSDGKSSGYLKFLGKTKLHFISLILSCFYILIWRLLFYVIFKVYVHKIYIYLSAENVIEVSLEEQKGDDDDNGIAHQVRKHLISHLVFYCV